MGGFTRVLSTQLTEALGAVLHFLFLGDAILISIGFQTIAFVGIVVFLRAVEPKLRVPLTLLTMLPSFTVWSSIASKEAIVVGALGILSAYVIDLYRNRAQLQITHIIAVAIVFVYKTHYLAALAFLILGTLISNRIRQKSLIVLAAGITSIGILFLVEDRVADLALEIVPHFRGYGESTREAFWNTPADVLAKAPHGMFLGFFGPTIDEATKGILQLASFVESSILLGVLAFFVIRQLFRLPVYMVLMSGFSLFWILFATYPLGVMNPGSAVRYRTGYEIFVFLLIVVLLSRQLYVNWNTHDRTPSEQGKSK